MFVIWGVGSRRNYTGVIVRETCDRCGTTNDINIIADYKCGTIFFIPIFKFGRRYYEVCPNCGAFKEISKGEFKEIKAANRSGLIYEAKDVVVSNVPVQALESADAQQVVENKISKEDVTKEINEIIISNSKLLNNYIIITSYDSVSEYYCNKVYPKLNEFERKFRKLLFITYTAQFKKLYFEVTTSEKLREKAKEVIQSDDNDYRLQQYLYSLDFGAFKKLLFDKSWTEYDEKQRNKYLKKYGDLDKLTDLEIKNTMINRNKRNDWERLFSNKGLKENFEKIISRIGKLRNIVAHNKIINEEEYNELNELLDDSIITIEQAIKVTETEDFKRINMEKVYETFEKVVETLKKYTDGIRKKANKLHENKELKNALNFLGNIAIETLNEENEANEENEENDEDDEGNNTKN